MTFPFDLLFIPLDLPLNQEPAKPVTSTFLNVRLKFKDSSVQETVNFKNISAFDMIADDVNVLKWKLVKDDGSEQFEIITEGSDSQSMIDFVSTFKNED
jgi:hypothetical protein